MTIWFTSDTHFSHANILTFKDPWGELMRPFLSVEEMDETLVERWNDRVKPSVSEGRLSMWYNVRAIERKEVVAMVEATSAVEALELANHQPYEYDWDDTGMLLEYESLTAEEEPINDAKGVNPHGAVV